MQLAEKLFKLKEHKTTVRTEISPGLQVFMTMACILVVNPNILSDAGMDIGAAFTATSLVSAQAIHPVIYFLSLLFILHIVL